MQAYAALLFQITSFQRLPIVRDKVSELLQLTVRNGDTVARLGGDEFSVILEDCTSAQALQVAQKICDYAGDVRFVHGKQRFLVGTSIGLVPLDDAAVRCFVDVAHMMG